MCQTDALFLKNVDAMVVEGSPPLAASASFSFLFWLRCVCVTVLLCCLLDLDTYGPSADTIFVVSANTNGVTVKRLQRRTSHIRSRGHVNDAIVLLCRRQQMDLRDSYSSYDYPNCHDQNSTSNNKGGSGGCPVHGSCNGLVVCEGVQAPWEPSELHHATAASSLMR